MRRVNQQIRRKPVCRSDAREDLLSRPAKVRGLVGMTLMRNVKMHTTCSWRT